MTKTLLTTTLVNNLVLTEERPHFGNRDYLQVFQMGNIKVETIQCEMFSDMYPDSVGYVEVWTEDEELIKRLVHTKVFKDLRSKGYGIWCNGYEKEIFENAQEIVLKYAFSGVLELKSSPDNCQITCPIIARKKDKCLVLYEACTKKALWKSSEIVTTKKDYVNGLLTVQTKNGTYILSLYNPLSIIKKETEDCTISGRGGKIYTKITLSREATKEEVISLLEKENYNLHKSQGWWDSGYELTGSGKNWTYIWDIAYTD